MYGEHQERQTDHSQHQDSSEDIRKLSCIGHQFRR